MIARFAEWVGLATPVVTAVLGVYALLIVASILAHLLQQQEWRRAGRARGAGAAPGG